jgi:hypothetical protein
MCTRRLCKECRRRNPLRVRKKEKAQEGQRCVRAARLKFEELTEGIRKGRGLGEIQILPRAGIKCIGSSGELSSRQTSLKRTDLDRQVVSERVLVCIFQARGEKRQKKTELLRTL